MENTLTKSVEDYLEAILVLQEKEGRVHSVAVADFLNVSKPAVSQAMEELLEKGYVQKEPYGDIYLTKSGEEVARTVYHRHMTIKSFLLNLGVDEATAEHDCCLMEHILSEGTFQKIEEAVEKADKGK